MGASSIVIRLAGDASQFRRELGQAESTAQRFKKRIQIAAAGIAAGAVVAGRRAIEIASDTNEALSKSQTVFGTAASGVEQYAKTAAAVSGLSKRAALDLTGAMGSILVAQGDTQDQAAKLSLTYTKLAADLGSFNNTSTEEAAEALKASLTGEFEQLKKYGIVINDARLKQEAMAQGVKMTGNTFTAQQKKQLAYSIIMRDTAQAQGDFQRTSGGLANQTKILQAQMENLQGEIGAKLLPVAIKIANAFNGILNWVRQNQTQAKILAVVVGTLAAAVVGATVAIRVWEAAQRVATVATKAWALAQRAVNLAMNMSPIGRIILIVTALTAAIVLAWRNSETFRRIVTGAFNRVRDAAAATFGWVRAHWPLILGILTGPVGAAVILVAKNFGRIRSAITSVRDHAVRIFGGLGEILTAPFRAAVQGLRDAWNSTVGGRGIHIPSIDLGFTKIGGGGFTIPQLAEGGTARAGMAHLVGERGPELFVPGRTGTVVPNHALGGDLVVELHGDREALEALVTRVVVRRDRATANAVRAGARRAFA